MKGTIKKFGGEAARSGLFPCLDFGDRYMIMCSVSTVSIQ